MARLVFY